MLEDSSHLRSRARDCRNLAKSARDQVDAAMLEEIAEELDVEARKIEVKRPARADEPEPSPHGGPRTKARN